MKRIHLAARIALNFLRAYRGTVALCAAMCAIFSAIHLLRGGSARDIGYPLLLCGALMAGVGAVTFAHFGARQIRLWETLAHVPEDPDALPEAHTPFEADFRRLAASCMKARTDGQTASDAAARDRDDYYTLWMHQIKTPLSALDLMAQSEGGIDRALMRQELFKIGQYADSALTYQRLESLHRDLDLHDVRLYPLCCQCVKKLRPLFLYRKIRLDMPPFEGAALTDAKWLGFVVAQVLTNSLKYTPEGGLIAIRSAEPGLLEIADTGVGVPPEDAPRVFDRGFTGRAGRGQDKSTGIGLYLCRRVCDELGHGITLSSAPGAGTRVTIDARRAPYIEM